MNLNQQIKPSHWTFGVWGIGIAFIWLVVLPQVGTHPQVRERIEFLDEKKIDPAALFYTDLELMKEVGTASLSTE